MPGEHQMPAPMSSAAAADAGPTAKKSGWLRTYSLGTPRCWPPGAGGASSRAVGSARPARRRCGGPVGVEMYARDRGPELVAASPVAPRLLVEVAPDARDVRLGPAVVPAARVPRTHAAPVVAA